MFNFVMRIVFLLSFSMFSCVITVHFFIRVLLVTGMYNCFANNSALLLNTALIGLRIAGLQCCMFP